MTKLEKIACEFGDMFDDFLEERDVRIPSSEEEKAEDGNSENNARIYGRDWEILTDKLTNMLDDFLIGFANSVIRRVEEMDVVACDEHAQAVFVTDVLKEIEEARDDYAWLNAD